MVTIIITFPEATHSRTYEGDYFYTIDKNGILSIEGQSYCFSTKCWETVEQIAEKEKE